MSDSFDRFMCGMMAILAVAFVCVVVGLFREFLRAQDWQYLGMAFPMGMFGVLCGRVSLGFYRGENS